MKPLKFEEISSRLKSVDFPEVDHVIGIGSGGIIPASLVAHQLAKPLEILHINFRNEDNTLRYDQPLLIKDISKHLNNYGRILLIDDVAVTGKTLDVAKNLLSYSHQITTMVLKGRNADIIIFPEISECVRWPWKEYNTTND